jgi:hypothetical protein
MSEDFMSTDFMSADFMSEVACVITCRRISASNSGFKGSEKNFANVIIEAETLSFGSPKEAINEETEANGGFVCKLCDFIEVCEVCGVFTEAGF